MDSDQPETAVEGRSLETVAHGFIKKTGYAQALDRMIRTYMMNKWARNNCDESQNASHMGLDRFEPLGYAMLVPSGGW
jgi:hypothetical protein